MMWLYLNSLVKETTIPVYLNVIIIFNQPAKKLL